MCDISLYMKKISASFARKLKKIKLIGFDFDGVFTDAKVILNQEGVEAIVCSRRDSLGLNYIRKQGMKCAVISMEPNPVIAKRCEKLKLECLTGSEKLPMLKQLLKREHLSPGQVAYVGDDLNDLECMKYAGVAFTVADAADECKRVADYVTTRKSGDHAVREICNLFLKLR